MFFSSPCISSVKVFTNHCSLWSIFKYWKKWANINELTQYSYILTQLIALYRITCGNCQLKNLFCFQNCYFLEQQSKDLFKVYYAYMCIDIYFIGKNDTLFAVDGVTNTHLQHSNSPWLDLDCFTPPCSYPSSGNVNLILQLCTSVIPALAPNLTSDYFFKLVNISVVIIKL